MVRSVVKNCFDSDYRISCEGTFYHRVLKSFFYSREVVLRNSAAYHFFFKYIRSLQITGWFKPHLYMSVLTMSAGLFFVFCVHIRFLTDCLTERHFRCLQFNFYFISGCQFAGCDFQVLISHTVKKRLSVLTVIDCSECHILCHHLLQCLRYLVFIPFCQSLVSHIGIWNRIICSGICNRRILCRKSISCLCTSKLCDCSDISCKQFGNFCRFVSAHRIKLARFFLGIRICIVKYVIPFEYTGAYLYK